jgi:signal transduction histidine kinase
MNMGLGLYFCRLAVEAHGGRIWTEINGELPTTFALELPL